MIKFIEKSKIALLKADNSRRLKLILVQKYNLIVGFKMMTHFLSIISDMRMMSQSIYL